MELIRLTILTGGHDTTAIGMDTVDATGKQRSGLVVALVFRRENARLRAVLVVVKSD